MIFVFFFKLNIFAISAIKQNIVTQLLFFVKIDDDYCALRSFASTIRVAEY